MLTYLHASYSNFHDTVGVAKHRKYGDPLHSRAVRFNSFYRPPSLNPTHPPPLRPPPPGLSLSSSQSTRSPHLPPYPPLDLVPLLSRPRSPPPHLPARQIRPHRANRTPRMHNIRRRSSERNLRRARRLPQSTLLRELRLRRAHHNLQCTRCGIPGGEEQSCGVDV